MNSIYKKKSFIVKSVVVLALLSLAPVFVQAATFNNDPLDFATLRAVNSTDNPSCTSCWTTSVSADAGDVVSFAIYYHNTGPDTARNVRVRLSPQSTSVGTNHTFTAQVLADNAGTVSGNTTISLSSSQSMSFTPGTVVWRPDQTVTGSRTLPNGQSGSEIFNTNGLLLGDIAPGFSSQGSLVLSFEVSGSGGNNNNVLPTVTTLSADVVNQNVAILRGNLNLNGATNATRWFEYGTNSNSLNQQTTKLGQSFSGQFSETVSGLSFNTTYFFRAVAQTNAGTVFGGVQSFFTGSGTGTGDRPFVTTNAATNVQQFSATLNGFVNPRNSFSTTRWFEWGTTQSLGNQTSRLNHGSTASNFADTITGLSNNTTYFFRAVAQNEFGTTFGNILSFNTGTGSGGTIQPTVITNTATNIGQTSGRLNGLVLTNGNTFVNGWFEWGVTQSLLGNTTPEQGLGSQTSIPFSASLFDLSPNTTYHYRAVAQTSAGLTRGNILSFRTNSVPVTTPTTPTTPSVTRDADVFKEVENLDSPNGTRTETEALPGEHVRFTIEAENTGDTTLEEVEIKDRIPFFLEFANASDRVTFDRIQREVVWFVGDLRPGERVSVELDMVVTDDARLGSVIENVAQLESTRITRTSNEVTIEVVDRVSGLAALSLFGAGGFLPNTLIEWLLLILIILGLVIAGRKIAQDSKTVKAAA